MALLEPIAKSAAAVAVRETEERIVVAVIEVQRGRWGAENLLKLNRDVRGGKKRR